MATKKPMKKFKRYEGGGEVIGEVDPKEAAAKEAGLKASKGEDVGFFERMRMGNIDKPGTEAYNRFGAGRGRDRGESVSVNQSKPATTSATPSNPSAPISSSTPLSDDMYSDYGPSAGRSYSETITSSRPVEKKPVAPAKPTTTRDSGESVSVNKPVNNFSNEGRNKPAPASKPSMDISKMKEDAKAALDEDPSALMMGGGAAAATAAALLAKTKLGKFAKMFKGAKGVSDAKRLERPGTVSGKDFLVRDYEGAAKAGSKGVPKKQLGYSKDTDVTDVMAKKRGGAVKKMASGGSVSSASKRADGIATKGKTRGRMC